MSPVAKKRAAKKIKPWLSGIARIGFAGKGAIYLMVGLLTLTFAIGVTSEVQDLAGAIDKVSQQPFGKVVLLVLAFGLLNYALWNAVQCLWDPERVGGNWIGNALRGIFGLSAAFNLFLAYKTAAVGLGRGWGGNTGDEAVQSWTQRALLMPGGRALVLAAAAVMAGIAASLVVRLVRGKYIHLFAEKQLARAGSTMVKACAWYGFLAQALVTILIAWFLWRAGLTAEPQEAGGFTKALATLFQQPYGRWLLGITGLGVMAQGVYIWLMVPYREIHVDQVPDSVRERWGRAWGW